MRGWKTKNGAEIIRVLSGRSNAYVVVDENHLILVDTGRASEFGTLVEKMNLLNLSVDTVSSLILTHTHFDHCQSAKKIKEISNCQVVVSDKAVNSIKYGYTKLPKGTLLLTKIIAKFGQSIGKRKYGYQSFVPDILIKESHRFKLAGCEIEILATAGHSTDSISIIVNDEVAIVGDAMFGVFRNSVFPPYADDIETMIINWGKLLNTGCKIFLPGHGNEISRELLQNEYDRYARKYKIDKPARIAAISEMSPVEGRILK